jgi:hypothetical protein
MIGNDLELKAVCDECFRKEYSKLDSKEILHLEQSK